MVSMNWNMMGKGKRKASLYIMLEHVAKVMDLRAGEAVSPSGSQHSSGPVLQRGHGKERIWEAESHFNRAEIVLLLSEWLQIPLSLFLCLSELKTARIEEPENLPFFPTSNHGVSIFPVLFGPVGSRWTWPVCSFPRCMPPFSSLLSSLWVLGAAHQHSESCLAGTEFSPGQSAYFLWGWVKGRREDWS